MSENAISNQRLCEILLVSLPDAKPLVEAFKSKPVAEAYQNDKKLTFYVEGIFGYDSMEFNLSSGNEAVTVKIAGYDEDYTYHYEGSSFSELKAGKYAELISHYESMMGGQEKAKEQEEQDKLNTEELNRAIQNIILRS